MKNYSILKSEQLRKDWNQSFLDFNTTEDLEPFNGIIGQERAIRAMEFGTKIKAKGYNVFITGVSGTGKTTYAKEYLSKVAKTCNTPDDWCYVYNFEDPNRPVAINLPCGKGREFYRDILELMQEIRNEITKAFSGEAYDNERTNIVKELQEKRNQLFDEFNNYAKEQGFQMSISNSGMYFTPIIDGKPVGEDEYANLDDETKKYINDELSKIQFKAVDYIRKIKTLEKEARDKSNELENRIGLFAVGFHIDDMKDKYIDYPKIIKYLDDLKRDILENLDDFKQPVQDEDQNEITQMLQKAKERIDHKYSVNLLVDNNDKNGAPVVLEFSPTYTDLYGTFEYENRLGTIVTDFTKIKPGSAHKANGGYLVLQASDVLSTPFAWESLKKILKTKCITIENLRDQYGLMSISTLKPEPIPIDIKIVLIGSEYLFELLHQLDEDFPKLFKIKVDFDYEMEANEQNLMCLAGFIKSYCIRENSRHFTKAAVIRLAQYSSRLIENQNKFTTRFNEIVEVLAEANTWAEIAGKTIVTAEEVDKAIYEKIYRSNRYDRKLLELIDNDTIMVDTDGEVIGQINGLSVLNAGDFIFGKPSKITANTYIGKNGIINIEREVSMSGTSHSKGVMILCGYIGEKYAQDIPLSLNASITFEQLYSGVDGDSASSAELYSILSSLAGVPIKQGIAVTGSINQKGEIQPVGGVTYKIEGFFDLCELRGLSGNQGVIIPYKNVNNLVLKDKVIDAVDKGLFHIYAISNVDQGIEILTDIPAGKKLMDSRFQKGTIHEMVYNKLRQYALDMYELARKEKHNDK